MRRNATRGGPARGPGNRAAAPAVLLSILLLTTALAGCAGNGGGTVELSQTGSSTVLPLAIRWAEEFTEAEVSVSGGGSSHGINSLLTGEADLGDASRKIGASDYADVGCSVTDQQITDAQTGEHPYRYPTCNGVTPTEWVVAFDVLTVVVHNDNGFATELNYTQLYAIFSDDDPAVYWDEVPGLEDSAPHEEIEIFAPDEASGTYEFFFEQIIPDFGDEGAANSRLASGDGVYHPSADDNVILRAISQNRYAIGYFGFAYYLENEGSVQRVALDDDGTDHVAPSFETVESYPMTRPIHIYTDGVPSGDDAKGATIRAYLAFVLSDAGQGLVPEVGYVKVGDVNPDLLGQQRDALT